MKKDLQEDETLRELDKFLQRLLTYYNRSTKKIDWDKIKKEYKTPEEQKSAELIKKYIKGLIEKKKSCSKKTNQE